MQVSVATVGLDKAISIWDLRAPKSEAPALRIAGAHASEVLAVAWHPGGGMIATGGADAAVKLWDPRRAAGGVSAPAPAAAAAALCSYAGHMGAVAKLAFSPDGNQLGSVGADGCLIQWRVV